MASLLTSSEAERRAAIVAPHYVRLVNKGMPPNSPRFVVRTDGARFWDLDGHEYLDFMCAGGPNLLGYRHPEVEAAAERQRALGDTMIAPAPVMIELSEKLVAMVSHADWVLYAKNGSDATTAALRIARAQSGKRGVLTAKAAYHGSAAWCTPFLSGVLPEEQQYRGEFIYNDVSSLEAAVDELGNDLAAIFVTGIRHESFVPQELPTRRFALRCRELCDVTGALLVVDDVRAGFRVTRDCSWATVGVCPDLSCWSKAIANGYPLSVVLGSDFAREGLLRSLLVGTFWLQAVPMAAALETLRIITETAYLERIAELGRMLRVGLHERARCHGFELNQSGPEQMPLVYFDGDPAGKLGSAFMAAMLERGMYMNCFHNMYLSTAMTAADIAMAIAAADEAFAYMAAQRLEIESAEAPSIFRDSSDVLSIGD
jgi:glutamate-1-semialdehyde 2,1-aminomutase